MQEIMFKVICTDIILAMCFLLLFKMNENTESERSRCSIFIEEVLAVLMFCALGLLPVLLIAFIWM